MTLPCQFKDEILNHNSVLSSIQTTVTNLSDKIETFMAGVNTRLKDIEDRDNEDRGQNGIIEKTKFIGIGIGIGISSIITAIPAIFKFITPYIKTIFLAIAAALK